MTPATLAKTLYIELALKADDRQPQKIGLLLASLTSPVKIERDAGKHQVRALVAKGQAIDRTTREAIDAAMHANRHEPEP